MRRIKRVRRKLVAFTDTKGEALRKRRILKKKGFKNFLLRKEYSAYGLYALKSKKK